MAGSVLGSLESPRGRQVAVTVLVLALLLATAAAFAVAERLKLERSPVTAPIIDRIVGPTCRCEQAVARLGLRLRGGHTIDVSIVDAAGRSVRVLATALRRPAGPVRFAWDGRDDAGDVVPDGRYRLRVRLRDERRAITVPTPIRVDSTPPRIRLVSASPGVLSPDDDGRGDRVQYVYRVNELARAWVVVNGVDTVRGRLGRPGRGRVRWRGRVRGEPASPGTYETWLVAEDEAGNRSARTRTIQATVRYVRIVGMPRTVRAGGRLRFSVDADAKKVTVLTRTRSGSPVLAGRFDPGPVAIRVPRAARGSIAVVAQVGSTGRDRAVVRVARP